MMRRVLPLLMSVLLTGQIVPAALAETQPDVNFKVVGGDASASADSSSAAPESNSSEQSLFEDPSAPKTETQATSPAAPAAAADASAPNKTTTQPAGASVPATSEAPKSGAAEGQKIASKVLQGYIRVVPSGTKIPIIMDTAVDSDTSQEGDEFSARTAEDLSIDGSTVVPAGSIIKGRIAQMSAARRLARSGSVALKFDSVTTPDNRQIPIVANLVAHGGVVHARRGMKDIAIDSSIVVLPTVVGLGIGLLAGSSSSSSKIGAGGGAVIGAAVGLVVGTAILLARKGKKVDMRPGDELKIELAEDLRMPM